MSDPIAEITAVLALGLSVFQEIRHWRLDRTELLLTAMVGYEFSPADEAALAWQRASAGMPSEPTTSNEISGQAPRLVFTLKNTGRRVVRVVSFGGDVVGHDRHFFDADPTIGLPIALQEGERHVFNRSVKLLAEAHGITSFHVHDSLDRVWALSHIDFLELQSNARRELREWEKNEKIRLEGLVERRPHGGKRT